jgi:hypothetical protein
MAAIAILQARFRPEYFEKLPFGFPSILWESQTS